jgi:hypothetical protein
MINKKIVIKLEEILYGTDLSIKEALKELGYTNIDPYEYDDHFFLGEGQIEQCHGCDKWFYKEDITHLFDDNISYCPSCTETTDDSNCIIGTTEEEEIEEKANFDQDNIN